MKTKDCNYSLEHRGMVRRCELSLLHDGGHLYTKGPEAMVSWPRYKGDCVWCDREAAFCDCAHRIACPTPNRAGHRFCGVCPECLMPRFTCGCDTPPTEERPSHDFPPGFFGVEWCSKCADNDGDQSFRCIEHRRDIVSISRFELEGAGGVGRLDLRDPHASSEARASMMARRWEKHRSDRRRHRKGVL